MQTMTRLLNFIKALFHFLNKYYSYNIMRKSSFNADPHTHVHIEKLTEFIKKIDEKKTIKMDEIRGYHQNGNTIESFI